MVKAVGTDSGIKSYDMFGFDDTTGEIFIDEAIPREEVTEDPSLVIRKLRDVQEKHGKIAAIVASSGYGVPLKPASEATDADIAFATFVTERDVERRLKIIGLRKLMHLMREAKDLNIYFTPGAIHLPTIPKHRKANRIDLGTSDKVYTAALAIKDQAERLEINYDQTSLVAVEIGFSYTSALAVEGGKIVDAMAGTAGFPGYSGMGFMDSELAYALSNLNGELSKTVLFQGGAAHVSGFEPSKVEPEEFVKRGGEGYELMLESVVKDVASLLPSVRPREVLLSGRFSRIPKFFRNLKERLEEFFSSLSLEVTVLKLRHEGRFSKEAAQGSALIANGLAGGKYRSLVDTMKLKEGGGSIFDYIYVKGKERLQELFGHQSQSGGRAQG